MFLSMGQSNFGRKFSEVVMVERRDFRSSTDVQIGVHTSSNVQRATPCSDNSFPPNCNCLDGREMYATASTRKQKKGTSESKKTKSLEQSSAQVWSLDIILLSLRRRDSWENSTCHADERFQLFSNVDS